MVGFLHLFILLEALIFEDATDAVHVQKLTVVLEIVIHIEQDQVFLGEGGYFRNYGISYVVSRVVWQIDQNGTPKRSEYIFIKIMNIFLVKPIV